MITSQVTHLHGATPERRSNSKRSPHPLGFLASAWRHRSLIYRLARREVESRYRGSLLGFIWSFLLPLMMLGVYTFVFSVIFKQTWPIPPGGKGKFFIIIFAGMICLNLFNECIARAPSLMLGNVNYIKKVVFPLEILSLVILASEIFNAFVSTIVLAIVYVTVLGKPPATAILFPVMIFPLLLVILGLMWFISSLGVYLRDLRQIIMVILGMIGFVSPLFYPLSRFPDSVRWATYINPLTAVLEQVRAVLFWGTQPNWYGYAAYLLAGWVIASLGWIWFSHAKRGFADVV